MASAFFFWSGVSDLDVSLDGHEALGGLPYERDRNGRRKIGIETPKDTNLGVAQALFEP